MPLQLHINVHVCVCVCFRLESPTRTLTLEAPRGVEVNAGVGDFTAYCRKDLLLQSSEGEVSKLYTFQECGQICGEKNV